MFKGWCRLCPSPEEKHHFYGPNYVERRNLWDEKIFLNNPMSDFDYFNEKKFGLSTEFWVEHFV